MNTMNTTSRFLTGIMKYAVLVAFALFTFAPFYWGLASSLKLHKDIFTLNPTFFPREPTLINYVNLFKETELPRWMANSMIVSAGTTLLGVFICSLAGYAFAKYSFRGKNALFLLVLSSVSIPQAVTLIPMFTIMSRLGWLNTYHALILPAAANAFGIFLMRQYILSVPDDLIDAGRMDGCSEFGIYWRIILPVVRPALGALAIFLWLNSWVAYIWPLIVVEKSEMYTMPLGLATLFSNVFSVDYGMVMAGAMMSILPIVLIFLLMQRQFIAGLTQGAVKT